MPPWQARADSSTRTLPVPLFSVDMRRVYCSVHGHAGSACCSILQALFGGGQHFVEAGVATQLFQQRVVEQVGICAEIALDGTLEQKESSLVLAAIPEQGALIIQDLRIRLDRQV